MFYPYRRLEEALYVFYPLYQQDRTERARKREQEMGPKGTKEPDTAKERALYMDYLSRILCGLAQQNSYQESAGLYFFLLKHGHHDLEYDLSDFFYKDVSPSKMFEKYIHLKKNHCLDQC